MDYKIDLNCDMGEEMPFDAQLMPFISSANIACGYHAGNEDVMRKTIELALKNKVAIGAHPSYPDRENFGRKVMILEKNKLYDLIIKQLDILSRIAKTYQIALHHVKPHGALYNEAARNPEVAQTICQALFDFDKNLILYGLSGSCLLEMAKNLGLKTCSEAFADRVYETDGSLRARNLPFSVLTDTEKVKKQVLEIVLEKKVQTFEGKKIPIRAETMCLHGDGENVVELVQIIHKTLIERQITIQKP